MRIADADDELRAAAFDFLRDVMSRSGGIVTRRDVSAFEFRGVVVPLHQHMRGIRFLSGQPALSILTTFRERAEERPYEDDLGEDGYPRYKWQGVDPQAPDNRALREAMRMQKPLIWFIGVAPGVYEPVFPVWAIGEEPTMQRFVIALDEGLRTAWLPEAHLTQPDLIRRREYALAIVRRRLHQPEFRRSVIRAYRMQCAICRLRHPELLDAAHILEDARGGQPIVPNGIAMCAIHHRAFDAHVVGVRPDYIVEIRSDVLREQDGPTLQHALQAVHGVGLHLPRRPAAQPDRDLLEERYERFRSA